MTHRKVLIIDDNSEMRTQLRELLPKGNYEIQEATDGEEGFSLVQQEGKNVRFIILDAGLPKLNGWEFITQLSADRSLPTVPLVLMTAEGEGSQGSDPSSFYPFMEVLPKPFEKRDLQTVVKSAIAKIKAVVSPSSDHANPFPTEEETWLGENKENSFAFEPDSEPLDNTEEGVSGGEEAIALNPPTDPDATLAYTPEEDQEAIALNPPTDPDATLAYTPEEDQEAIALNPPTDPDATLAYTPEEDPSDDNFALDPQKIFANTEPYTPPPDDEETDTQFSPESGHEFPIPQEPELPVSSDDEDESNDLSDDDLENSIISVIRRPHRTSKNRLGDSSDSSQDSQNPNEVSPSLGDAELTAFGNKKDAFSQGVFASLYRMPPATKPPPEEQDEDATQPLDWNSSNLVAHEEEAELPLPDSEDDFYDEEDFEADEQMHTILEDRKVVSPFDFPPPQEIPSSGVSMPKGMVTLRGFEEVQMRFESTIEEERIAAIKEAFNYKEDGIQLVLKAIKEETGTIQETAEKLIIENLINPHPAQGIRHENWSSIDCLHILAGHSYWVQDLAIAPDSRTFVSASKDSTIRIWDLATGQEKKTLSGHKAAVLSVTITPDGEQIISSSIDNTIKIWNLQTGKEQYSFSTEKHNIYALAVSPDGKTLFTTNSENTTQPKYKGGLGAFLNRIPSASVSPILSLLGLVSGNPTIQCWDLQAGQKVGNFRGYSRGVVDVAISPRGDKLVSGSRDHTLKIWDVKTRNSKQTLLGHNDEIRTVVVSPDGQTVISGSRDNTLKIWDINTGDVLHTLRDHRQSVTTVAISPDGKTIVSGSRDHTVKLWDFQTGELITTLTGHRDLVRSVAVSPDGQFIISGSRDSTIRIWGNR